jgi:hypothetical protein
MANYTMPAADNVRMLIDFDNDETDRKFVIEHNAGGGVVQPLWSVDEAGRVTLYGELKRALTSPTFNNDAASGDIAAFKSAGTLKAKVDGAGKATFNYGMRLPRNTSANDPDTAGLAGSTGDLIIWHNSGTGKDEIWCCNDGAGNHWNQATHA